MPSCRFSAKEDWNEVLEVNLNAAFRLTKCVIKGMLTRRWGRVIAISSASGVAGQIGQTHYSAAKAGLIGFTKALAKEVATFGVTSNAIAPGFVDTDLLQGDAGGQARRCAARRADGEGGPAGGGGGGGRSSSLRTPRRTSPARRSASTADC